jgi:hypothetical protein
MSRDFYTLDELVQRLGRDRRQIEKLVNRGSYSWDDVLVETGDSMKLRLPTGWNRIFVVLMIKALAQLEQSQQSGHSEDQEARLQESATSRYLRSSVRCRNSASSFAGSY